VGFVADTPIVTAAEVAAITLEAGLANLDSKDGATLDAAIAQATNAIMLDLRRRRGVEPSRVRNVADFKRAAAFHVAAARFRSLPLGDRRQAKGGIYFAKYEQEIDTVQIDGPPGEANVVPLGLPRGLAIDAEPTFRRPVDNRPPGTFLGPYYRQ
jgi:hypothetical protein